MAAPGDNLEFQASAFFRARTAGRPALLERVKEALRHGPALGKEFCPGIRELEFEFAGEGLVIFLARRDLRQLYGKGGLA